MDRGLLPVFHSVLNVKALVGTFNQENALSVIVKYSGNFVGSSNDLTTTNLSSAMLQLFKYLSFVPVFAAGCGRAGPVQRGVHNLN